MNKYFIAFSVNYLHQRIAREGLASANKGNPFWSKRDAMQLLNMVRANAPK